MRPVQLEFHPFLLTRKDSFISFNQENLTMLFLFFEIFQGNCALC